MRLLVILVAAATVLLGVSATNAPRASEDRSGSARDSLPLMGEKGRLTVGHVGRRYLSNHSLEVVLDQEIDRKKDTEEVRELTPA